MKLTTILSTTVALALCLGATTGCDEPEERKAEARANDKNAEKAAPAKDPVALLKATKTPELPGPLATLAFGMTADEAKKAAPSLEDGRKFLDEYGGAYFSYYVPDDTGKLNRASLQIEGADMAKLLTEAWGEPKKGEDLGKPKFFWFNEAKKMRATVSQGYGQEDEVQFEAYLPAQELLGDGKATLGFEKADRPLLGATREQFIKSYADVLETLTEEEAEKKLKELEKLAGNDLSALGPDAASSNIDLLPTEYGSELTRVYPNFADDGTIDRFRVGIDFEPVPEAKEEILALIKAKWGEPTEEEKYGDTILVFSEDPRVTVKEDTISKKWDVEVELEK
ncbi:MAG: hypothetical protein AB1Z98_10310 [Nannocystaceae bacterium]